MDKDTFAGAVKEASGAAKEAFGSAIGDVKLKEAGASEKAAGRVEHLAGLARDSLRTAGSPFSASEALGLPLLFDNPAPLSSALHIPTLLAEPKTRSPRVESARTD